MYKLLTNWRGDDRQDKIDHAVLIRWTKGFGAAKVEGQDVAEMFRASLKKYVRRATALSCFPYAPLLTRRPSQTTERPSRFCSFDQRYHWNFNGFSLCRF